MPPAASRAGPDCPPAPDHAVVPSTTTSATPPTAPVRADSRPRPRRHQPQLRRPGPTPRPQGNGSDPVMPTPLQHARCQPAWVTQSGRPARVNTSVWLIWFTSEGDLSSDVSTRGGTGTSKPRLADPELPT